MDLQIDFNMNTESTVKQEKKSTILVIYVLVWVFLSASFLPYFLVWFCAVWALMCVYLKSYSNVWHDNWQFLWKAIWLWKLQKSSLFNETRSGTMLVCQEAYPLPPVPRETAQSSFFQRQKKRKLFVLLANHLKDHIYRRNLLFCAWAICLQTQHRSKKNCCHKFYLLQ